MAYVCKECEQEQTISFQQYADRQFICESCNGEIEAVDGRGLLFFEVARVARDKKPKFILLENVKGMVGHDKGRTLDTIVRTLSEIGYVVDFDVLNSKFYGVPQNRERIFIVAVREDIQQHEEWAEESLKGNTVVPKGKRRIAEYHEVKTFNFDFPANDTVTKRLRDILEKSVDESFYLDDERTEALVADLEERNVQEDLEKQSTLPLNLLSRGAEHRSDGMSYALKAAEGGSSKQHVIEGLPIREATTKGYAVAAEGDAVNFQFPNSKTRRGRVGKEIANTLEASNINQGVVEVSEDVRAVLTPDRLEKRQNGRRFKEVDEEMFTLTSQDRHGVLEEVTEALPMDCEVPQDPEMLGMVDIKGNESIRRVYSPNACGPTLTTMGGGHREPKIAQTESETYRIRKLTPKECWRLQGFTDEQHDIVELAGVSNSQRYKQAGNAVTVNVIEAIVKNLIDQCEEE